MGVALLDLVETALRVAKQALGNRAGKPDVALDGFVGITVLAISLVVAALAYFLYLSALESSAAEQ